ncbi:MAG: hypothetical protein ABTQ31_13205 [Rhizobiaceae bacterium]
MPFALPSRRSSAGSEPSLAATLDRRQHSEAAKKAKACLAGVRRPPGFMLRRKMRLAIAPRMDHMRRSRRMGRISGLPDRTGCARKAALIAAASPADGGHGSAAARIVTIRRLAVSFDKESAGLRPGMTFRGRRPPERDLF